MNPALGNNDSHDVRPVQAHRMAVCGPYHAGDGRQPNENAVAQAADQPHTPGRRPSRLLAEFTGSVSVRLPVCVRKAERRSGLELWRTSHPIWRSRDSWASAILGRVDSGERVRRPASRRFAGQIESIAQGVAQRVIEIVVDALDVNALIDRINLNAVLNRVELNDLLRRVDLNEVLDHVDLNQVLDRLDLNQVLERVDLNQLLDRVDMDKLMARVDINEIVGRVDIEAMVKNTDLGAIMVSSSSTVATEAIDLGRSHAVSMDDTLARWTSRLRRNHAGQPGSPELPTRQEKP